jgi:hypothetical protein
MDDSSTGFNAFVGTLNNGNPQELDNLKAEWSVSANDATNRFVAAVTWKIPVGRGNLIGAHMNRALDAGLGGWELTTLTTFQTGQPLAIFMSNARIADGNQRPNVTCSKGSSLTTGISIHDAARYANPYINAGCFADPGDQQPGNARRYFSDLRSDGIHSTDLTLEKQYQISETWGTWKSTQTVSTAQTPIVSVCPTPVTAIQPLASFHRVQQALFREICNLVFATNFDELLEPGYCPPINSRYDEGDAISCCLTAQFGLVA